MNWGNKLLVVFIAFAALIGTLVYKSMHTKFDLVSTDYYKDELTYQDKIISIQNANKLSGVNITQDSASITLFLPKELMGEKIQGEAWFYCKTDADRDRKINIDINGDDQQIIDKKKLLKGNYQLKLSWKANNKNYYTEKDVFIQ